MMNMIALIVLIIVVGLGIAKVYNSSPKQKGKRGELRIQKILAQLPENDYTTFNDVVLRTAHGTTQIDHVVVSRYGIFVIETKNYRGEIFGNDDRQNWKQIIKTNVTFRKKRSKTYTYIKNSEFYNPVRQSLGHVAQVRHILEHIPNVKIVSIVVFSNQADLSGVNSMHHVIYASELLSCIRSYTNLSISEQDLTRVRIQLIDTDLREVVTDKEHKKNVQQARAYQESKIKDGICPRCGKPLVHRKGNFGNFYGCSGYPTCRFTKQC